MQVTWVDWICILFGARNINEENISTEKHVRHAGFMHICHQHFPLFYGSGLENWFAKTSVLGAILYTS